MGTKNKPAPFDCYANAEPDEPMFVLLARDESAPTLVRLWTMLRADRKGTGDVFITECRDAKAQEALDCADAMVAWREAQSSEEGTPK